jgi:altronate dehydratase small subunit
MKGREMHKAIVLDPRDNVATALNDLKRGDTLKDLSVGDSRLTVKLANDIPFGHKLSLYKIETGYEVIKYGETIGVATVDIGIGEHVHTYNVASTRGRERGNA